MRNRLSFSRLAPLLLAGGVALAYANSFAGVFLFDDFQSIVRRPELGHPWTAVAGAQRPLLALTFWANRAAGGLQPEGYHLVNLLVHAGAALLLFGVLRRAFGGLGPAAGEADAAAPAFAAALLWAVHPLNTGSVTYISQRAESLMWRDVARQCPHNLRARNDLAAALSEEGRAAEALAEYGAVLAAVPQEVALRLESGGYRPPERLPTDSWEYHYFRAHANMGLLMHRVLRDPAGAAAHYAAALRVLPGRADVAAKLRAALGESGAGAEP